MFSTETYIKSKDTIHVSIQIALGYHIVSALVYFIIITF